MALDSVSIADALRSAILALERAQAARVGDVAKLADNGTDVRIVEEVTASASIQRDICCASRAEGHGDEPGGGRDEAGELRGQRIAIHGMRSRGPRGDDSSADSRQPRHRGARVAELTSRSSRRRRPIRSDQGAKRRASASSS
jgi:hypothetical protein